MAVQAQTSDSYDRTPFTDRGDGIEGWASFMESAVEALEGDEDYRSLCRAIAESFGFSRVMLATVDRRRGIVAATAGFDPTMSRPIYQALLRLYRVSLEPDAEGRFSVAAWCLHHQEQIHVRDASDPTLLPDEIVQRTLLVKAMGTSEYVLTPIVCAGESVAMLAVDKKGQETGISPEDLTVLRAVASCLQLLLGPRLHPGSENGRSVRAFPIVAEGSREGLATGGTGLFGRVLESLRDALVVLDEDGRLRYVNKAFSRLVSIPRSRLVDRTVDELLASGEGPRLRKLFRSLDGPGERVELPDEGGDTLTVQVESFPISSSPRARARVFLIEDVTGRVELERMREEFIEMLVHDLKAPIQSIQGFTELLRLGRLGALSEEQLDFLERIEENSRQVLSRVEQLLEITQLETRRVRVRHERMDISELVGSVVRKLAGKALRRRIAVEVELPPDLPALTGDPVWLSEVFQNLLDNAIEAVQRGGSVRLVGRTVRSKGDPWIQVEIADDGPGLSAEEAARLFDRFWTEPRKLRNQGSGHGLGLLIARLVVELHGGRIGASAEPGSGTTVTVRLPGSAGASAERPTNVA